MIIFQLEYVKHHAMKSVPLARGNSLRAARSLAEMSNLVDQLDRNLGEDNDHNEDFNEEEDKGFVRHYKREESGVYQRAERVDDDLNLDPIGTNISGDDHQPPGAVIADDESYDKDQDVIITSSAIQKKQMPDVCQT